MGEGIVTVITAILTAISTIAVGWLAQRGKAVDAAATNTSQWLQQLHARVEALEEDNAELHQQVARQQTELMRAEMVATAFRAQLAGWLRRHSLTDRWVADWGAMPDAPPPDTP